jgi:hypothetical protein
VSGKGAALGDAAHRLRICRPRGAERERGMPPRGGKNDPHRKRDRTSSRLRQSEDVCVIRRCALRPLPGKTHAGHEVQPKRPPIYGSTQNPSSPDAAAGLSCGEQRLSCEAARKRAARGPERFCSTEPWFRAVGARPLGRTLAEKRKVHGARRKICEIRSAHLLKP